MSFLEQDLIDHTDDYKVSYDRIVNVARTARYAEMTGFKYLTENREVQTTTLPAQTTESDISSPRTEEAFAVRLSIRCLRMVSCA